jgi:histidinol-phosphate/aromatic aminotransferase/cobyric acid decarboxylase-like protein
MLSPTLSRRNFFRVAAGASVLASLPIVSEASLAWAQRARRFGDPNKGIHIDSNENPMGPCDAARQAIADLIHKGGRYFFQMEDEVVNLFAQQEGLEPASVRLYAGSSEPLAYTVLAFTSPSNPLVTADPGYEAALWSAAAGAPILKIPLADPKDAAPHDLRAMIAASPSTGVIYICNPNNPTGTCTPRADIEFAVAHAPKNTSSSSTKPTSTSRTSPTLSTTSSKAATSSSCAPFRRFTAWPACAWALPLAVPI